MKHFTYITQEQWERDKHEYLWDTVLGIIGGLFTIGGLILGIMVHPGLFILMLPGFIIGLCYVASSGGMR